MIIFYYLIGVIIFSRLLTTNLDEPLTFLRLIIKSSIVGFGLLFVKSESNLIILFILIVIVFLVMWGFEKKYNLFLVRAIEISLIAIILLFFCSKTYNVGFNTDLIARINPGLSSNMLFLDTITMYQCHKMIIIIMGVLLLMSESNLLIQYFLKLKGNDFSKGINENDTDEYNVGRYIGNLERIIFFILIFIDQYSSVGFIIAAKAFTRFKELEDRKFAEYVLVGTLMSLGLALIDSLYIKYLVSCIVF
jgi:hypothetical protein